MKIKYTAIGANNKKLEGILDAESIDAGREELHKMNLSVIAVNEISEEEAKAMESQIQAQPTVQAVATSEGETQVSTEATQETQATTPQANIVSYFFSAKDPSQKEVNGTIDADSPESAYRRLVTEYQFTIMDLYPEGADPASASLKGQFDEWKKELEEEGVDMEVHHAGAKSDLEDEEEEMSQEITNEIDQFIINTKKILSEHKDQYSEAFFQEIEKTLGELERIRSSNNLKHITKVCNNLYELISNPDSLSENGEAEQEYDSVISNLKESGFISNKIAFLQAHNLKKKSVKFEKIQNTFGKILGALNKKQASTFSEKLKAKKKGHHAKWLSQLTETLKGESKPDAITLGTLAQKLFAWASAPNAILRKARKQELIKTYHDWQKYQKKEKAEKALKKEIEEKEPGEKEAGEKVTLCDKTSEFFMEVDSFIGWLLFFYISYFFLTSFSMEKGIGIPQELVLKTFSSDLLVNIAIFLVIAHLAFFIKFRLFRGHLLSSIFLFFLSFGIYTILIANF